METNHQEWVLACDIDDTLVPIRDRTPEERADGLAALTALCAAVETVRSQPDADVYFGSVTGLNIASHHEYEAQIPAFSETATAMDFKITSVGSESYMRTDDSFIRIADWPPPSNWQRSAVWEALVSLPELTPQPDEAQGDYKVSFDVGPEISSGHDAVVTKITARLKESGIAAHVVFSGGVFLDILPVGVHKGTSLRHMVSKLPARKPFIIAADDSMNGKDLLEVADMAILPSNAHARLRQWAQDTIPPQKLYIAKKPFAAGILEGFDRLLNR